MFPAFEVIPAVDVQDGQVVQLVGGDPETGRGYGEPIAAAERWVTAGARTLHLVDLDGAIDGDRRNAGAIERILEAVDVDVQVGGGVRSRPDARSLLALGVDRVILGTAAVADPEIIADLSADYPDGIMVSLDASKGEVLVSGWTEGTGLDPAVAAERYEALGAGAILFTDVDVEGRLQGIRREPIERVASAVEIPVVASGGVTTLDDVRTVADAGAAAVVVGSALYEGRFTLGEAMAALE